MVLLCSGARQGVEQQSGAMRGRGMAPRAASCCALSRLRAAAREAARKAFASIMLNMAQESAARVLEAERRAAALAAGREAAKEDGVAALLRLKAIMEATVRQSPSIPLPDLLVEFARGLRVRCEAFSLGLYLDFARVRTNSLDWRVRVFAF